ncbi:transposase family protein [Streptomyces sp. NPDC058142]|uniref:transposase family protein n=1 Tax=Streptomyces sp. NPDC058142 TaxID=3346355 RepID=UPI0036EF9C39
MITLLARHGDHDAGTTLDVGQVVDLADVLDALPDPRRRQGRRYRLGPLLALCTIAVLAGATTVVAVARQAAYLPEEIRDRLGACGPPRGRPPSAGSWPASTATPSTPRSVPGSPRIAPPLARATTYAASQSTARPCADRAPSPGRPCT